MKKYFVSVFLVISIFLFISCSEKNNTLSFTAMDTFMTIRSSGKNCVNANKAAQARVEKIENLISVTKESSEIYRLNHKLTESFELSDETFYLMKYALDGAYKSNGAFNPALYPVTKEWGFTTKQYQVPDENRINEILKLTDYTKIQLQETEHKINCSYGMMFDFGAIGKGYAGDQIIEVLKENGIQSAILDLGGNIQLLGKKTDGSEWKIGLKNPFGGDVPVALSVSDCAVITSGGYERYFTGNDGKQYIHIFDGRTGKPVENNVVSATIVTSKGIYGDYLSTTTFILGKDGAVELWKKSGDFDFIMMFDDYSICYTKGLEGKISIFGAFSKIQVIE